MTSVHREGKFIMGFEQYHEPANELSEEIRTFARMIASMIEEADAINCYEQRMSLEKNESAKSVMLAAQKKEFKHFGMDLEFLLRVKPQWSWRSGVRLCATFRARVREPRC